MALTTCVFVDKTTTYLHLVSDLIAFQATAAFWASNGGRITKPPGNTGILDFLGVTSPSAQGTSKADEEFGPGLYITDDTIL